MDKFQTIKKLLKLYDEYSTRDDYDFEQFYDISNTDNMELKIEVIQWALDNNKLILDHPKGQQILDDYPTEGIFD